MPDDDSERCRAQQTYLRAIAIPPAELRVKQEALARALSGHRARLTSQEGTDLTLTVAANARFVLDDGRVTARPKSAGALSVRDRTTEIPASAMRTVDVSADGVLVARLYDTSSDSRVKIRFVGGRVVSLSGSGPGYADFWASYQRQTGNRDRLTTLLIGANPQIEQIFPSGFFPYFGTGGGNLQLRLGDNWESGGLNRVSGHWSALLIVTDATLKVGESVLIDGGVLQ
jgi:hypothetical protein